MSADLPALYRTMVRVRAFEDALLRLSQEGVLRGSLHLARGQEAIAAGLGAALLDRKSTRLNSSH